MELRAHKPLAAEAFILSARCGASEPVVTSDLLLVLRGNRLGLVEGRASLHLVLVAGDFDALVVVVDGGDLEGDDLHV